MWQMATAAAVAAAGGGGDMVVRWSCSPTPFPCSVFSSTHSIEYTHADHDRFTLLSFLLFPPSASSFLPSLLPHLPSGHHLPSILHPPCLSLSPASLVSPSPSFMFVSHSQSVSTTLTPPLSLLFAPIPLPPPFPPPPYSCPYPTHPPTMPFLSLWLPSSSYPLLPQHIDTNHY